MTSIDSTALWSATSLAVDEKRLSTAGLSIRQRKLLAMLAQPVSAQQLAQAISLPEVEVHAVLDRFARLGLAQSTAEAPRDAMHNRMSVAAAPVSATPFPLWIGIAVALLLTVGAFVWYQGNTTTTGNPVASPPPGPQTSATTAPATIATAAAPAAPAAGAGAAAASATAPASTAETASARQPATPTAPTAPAAPATSAASAAAKTATTTTAATPARVPTATASPGTSVPAAAPSTGTAAIASPSAASVAAPATTAAPITTGPVSVGAATSVATGTLAATPAVVATAPAAAGTNTAAGAATGAVGTRAATSPAAVSATPARAARLVTRVEPSFPRGIDVDQGTVRARLQVDARGVVSSVDILEANPQRVFDRSVRNALQQWRYEPTGEAFSAIAEISFTR